MPDQQHARRCSSGRFSGRTLGGGMTLLVIVPHLLLALAPSEFGTAHIYPFLRPPSISRELLRSRLVQLKAEIEKRPEDPEPLFQIAILHSAARDYLEALKAYQSALALAPGNERYLLPLIGLQARLGRHEEARALLTPLTKGGAVTSEARILLSFILQEQGQLQESETLLEQILEMEPDHRYALHLSGVGRFQANRMKEAVRRFQRAAELDTLMGESYIYLGKIYARDGQTHPKAIECFHRARRIHGPTAEISKELGLLYSRAARYEEAVRELREAIEMQADFPEAYYVLATTYGKMGRLPEAEAALARYREQQEVRSRRQISRDRSLAHYADAVEFLSRERLDDAYASFQKSADLDAKHGASHYGMAHIHFLRRQTARAVELARKAIEADPYSVDSYVLLAESLERERDYVGAIDALRTAISLSPWAAPLHNYLGNLCFQEGDLAQATEAYRRATRIDPKNSFYKLNLTSVLKRLGGPGSNP